MAVNNLHKPTVYLLETEGNSSRSVFAQTLNSFSFNVQVFSRGEDFMRTADHRGNGCVVCQLRLEDVSGIEIQERMKTIGSLLPIVMFSERASTQMVVRTMKNGAVSFLNSPANADELWLAVTEALAENAKRRKRADEERDLRDRFEELSESEFDVLLRMTRGYSNKQIASDLNVSVRTVESRKSRLLKKTGSKSVPEVLLAFDQYRKTDNNHSRTPIPHMHLNGATSVQGNANV